MLDSVFAVLSRAVEGSPLVAGGAAFTWGVLSILLSPCHLASIPLIIGLIDGQGRISMRRTFSIAVLFASGNFITIGLLGVITAGLGRVIGDVGRFGSYLVAFVFLLVGLHFIGVIPMIFSGPGPVKMQRKGIWAALVLGLVTGIALGPCTFAFMAPILAVSFRVAPTSLSYGILLLVLYGIGHCAVIVIAGMSTGAVQHYLNWNETSRGADWLKKVCGALIIAFGLYMLYIA